MRPSQVDTTRQIVVYEVLIGQLGATTREGFAQRVVRSTPGNEAREGVVTCSCTTRRSEQQRVLAPKTNCEWWSPMQLLDLLSGHHH
jgi:hypothetical protein